ncbi:hypothetical protein [Neptuniibacter sp. QD37_11]|uniref:hypothetical protein n=1 Tax=Neptuniibacter sp. QD37_11 TaxID=3398209 RepID=UPI0039F4C4B7
MAVRKTNAHEFTHDFGHMLATGEVYSKPILNFSDKFKQYAMSTLLAAQLLGIGNTALASTHENNTVNNSPTKPQVEQQVQANQDSLLFRDNIYVRDGVLILKNSGDAYHSASGVTYGLQKAEVQKFFNSLSDEQVLTFHNNMANPSEYISKVRPYAKDDFNYHDFNSADDARAFYTYYLHDQSSKIGMSGKAINKTLSEDYVALPFGAACVYTASQNLFEDWKLNFIETENGETVFHHNEAIAKSAGITPKIPSYTGFYGVSTGEKLKHGIASDFAIDHEENHCLFEGSSRKFVIEYLKHTQEYDSQTALLDSVKAGRADTRGVVADYRLELAGRLRMERLHTDFKDTVDEFHSDAKAIAGFIASEGHKGNSVKQSTIENMGEGDTPVDQLYRSYAAIRSMSLSSNYDVIHNTLGFMEENKEHFNHTGMDWELVDANIASNYDAEFEDFIKDYLVMEMVESEGLGSEDKDLDGMYMHYTDLYLASHAESFDGLFPDQEEALQLWNARVDLLDKYAGSAMSDSVAQHYRSYGEAHINHFYESKMTLDNAKYLDDPSGLEKAISRLSSIDSESDLGFEQRENKYALQLTGKTMEQIQQEALRQEAMESAPELETQNRSL